MGRIGIEAARADIPIVELNGNWVNTSGLSGEQRVLRVREPRQIGEDTTYVVLDYSLHKDGTVFSQLEGRVDSLPVAMGKGKEVGNGIQLEAGI